MCWNRHWRWPAQSPLLAGTPASQQVAAHSCLLQRAVPSAGKSCVTWKYLETTQCHREMLFPGGTARGHFHSCSQAEASPQLRPPARLPPLPPHLQGLCPGATLSAHPHHGSPVLGSAAGEFGATWPKSRTVLLSKLSICNILIAATHF